MIEFASFSFQDSGRFYLNGKGVITHYMFISHPAKRYKDLIASGKYLTFQVDPRQDDLALPEFAKEE